MTSNKIIEFDKVTKTYGNLVAVDNASFDIFASEFVTILGPSGCGKTTILKLIAGFEDVYGGKITLNGKLVSKPSYTYPPEKRKIGMVFQDFALFPHLSVEENIAFGLKGGVKKNQDRVKEMIELVDLKNKEKYMPYKLSGGELQRVSVARALANKPNIILLDEPFSSIDAKLRLQIRELIYYILRKQKVTAILVTHDQAEAFSFSDRIILMRDSNITQVGTSRDIYENPANAWIASFVGDANQLSFETSDVCFQSLVDKKIHLKEAQQIIIRPEDITVKAQESDPNGVITRVQYLGDSEYIFIKMEDNCIIKVKTAKDCNWQINQKVKIKARKYFLFPKENLLSPNF